MKKVYILGSGRFAQNLKSSLKDYNSGSLEFLGYIKKNSKIKKKLNVNFINGIGNFAYINYSKIINKYSNKKISFLTLVHNSAKIYPNSKIGKGSIVSENVLIKSDVKMGKHCIINSNVIISHNCILGEFVNISLGAIIAGNAVIGKNSFVGMGSLIINNIKIGKNVLIGAGSLVNKNLPDNVIAYGNPVKIIGQNNNEI